MPSSHAQFMTFFAVYVTLYLIHRFPPTSSNAHDRTAKITLWIRVLESVIVVGGAGLVAYSRIYLQYHTPPQVLVGVAIGAILGLGWYAVVLLLRAVGVVDVILHLRVVEMLWFKDGDIGSLEHDLRGEWREWRRLHDEVYHKKREGDVTKKNKGH
jgi:dolichyldiphosphatase